MSFSRANGSGWSSGDKFTAAQANTMDTNISNSFDIRVSQTNTVQSVTTFTTTGRLVHTRTAGVDADHTYAVADGITVIDAQTGFTANRTYTLSTTGAVTNDRIVVLGPSATYTLTIATPGTVLGTTAASTSTWAEFRYNGSAWELFRTARGSGYRAHAIPFQPTEYTSSTHTSAATIASPTLLPVTSTQLGWSATLGTSVLLKTVNTGTSASYAYRQWLSPNLLPQGMALSTVVMTLTGAGAHGGLPQQMPAIAVYRHSTDAALDTLAAAWAVDASGTTGAYQAEHTITFTASSNNIIDHSGYFYSLWMLGEGGSNALANLSILKVVFNFS